MAHH